MPTLIEMSRHLDRTVHRKVVRVRIRKIADGGRRWNILDANVMSSTLYGPEPWRGFATKTEAVDWIRQQNATDIMVKFVVSEAYTVFDK